MIDKTIVCPNERVQRLTWLSAGRQINWDEYYVDVEDKEDAV